MVAPASPIALVPAAPPVATPSRTTASLPPPSLAELPPAVAPARRTVPEPAPTVARPPAQPQVEGDLSSYIEARRRARGEAAAAPPQERPPQSPSSSAARSEDEKERSNRIIAANLGLDRTPTVGYDPKGGGGIFAIQRMGRDSAEFVFFGWNKDFRRNFKQVIEVDRGNNRDIQTAIVRRMIAIIREVESGDFLWLSQRLGRNVTLSARPRDNAELEDFMMQEFFAAPRG